jgi:hypothetical protein
MVTLDRIRLTGLLPESPAIAGLSHWRGRCRGQVLASAPGGGDDYHWQIVTRQIDPKATKAGVTIYVDSDAGSPSTVIVQQVYAFLGTTPQLRPAERPGRTRPYGD